MFFSLQHIFSIFPAVLYVLHVFWATLCPLSHVSCFCSETVKEGSCPDCHGLAGPYLTEPELIAVNFAGGRRIPVKQIRNLLFFSWLSGSFVVLVALLAVFGGPFGHADVVQLCEVWSCKLLGPLADFAGMFVLCVSAWARYRYLLFVVPIGILGIF